MYFSNAEMDFGEFLENWAHSKPVWGGGTETEICNIVVVFALVGWPILGKMHWLVVLYSINSKKWVIS